jgi:uncharacterized protein YukE
MTVQEINDTALQIHEKSKKLHEVSIKAIEDERKGLITQEEFQNTMDGLDKEYQKMSLDLKRMKKAIRESKKQ